MLLAAASLTVAFSSSSASAQTPVCETNTSNADKTGGNKFKINYDNRAKITGSGLSGLTTSQWKYVVLNAAEAWNEGANGGWLEHDGTTSVNYHDECGSEEQHNIVRIGYDGDGSSICDGASALGNFAKRCGSYWLLTLCADDGSGTNDFTVGEKTDTFDIQGILVHEFGHVLGLHHADRNSQDQTGVMALNTANGNLRKRNLYPWDIECHERSYGRRSETIRYRRQQHNNSTFDSTLYTMASGYARGVGNIRVTSGGTPTPAAVAYSYRFRNSTGFSLSSTPTNFNERYVGGFSNSWFPQLPSRWRTMYNYDYDSANRYENADSRTNVWQYAYDHSFSSGNLTQGRMEYCAQNPPLSCFATNIYIYDPISTAYDVVSDRTIFAWINATRQDGSDDHEIWISVGTRTTSGRLLNKPIKTGIRSSTNVSVACGPQNSADGLDCIIVYTPLSSTVYALRAKPFEVTGSGNTYSLSWGSTTVLGWLTGSNVTAWYNNGWRVAHTSGTNIQVRKSSDSVNWSHSETLQAAIGTPRAISVEENSDRQTRLYFTER